MSLTYEKLFSVLQKVGFSFSSIEEMKTMKGYLISRNCLLYKDNYFILNTKYLLKKIFYENF